MKIILEGDFTPVTQEMVNAAVMRYETRELSQPDRDEHDKQLAAKLQRRFNNGVGMFIGVDCEGRSICFYVNEGMIHAKD